MGQVFEKEYQEQSPRDCFLCHFLDEEVAQFNPKLFTLVRQTTVSISNVFAIEANIIGESHIIRLFKNGVPVFVELLSCVDPRDKGLQTDVVKSFAKSRSHHSFGGKHYTAAEIGKPILPSKRQSVEPSYKDGELLFEIFYKFPGILAPRTVVCCWLTPSGLLSWGSLHEYPIVPNFELIEPLVSETLVDLKRF